MVTVSTNCTVWKKKDLGSLQFELSNNYMFKSLWYYCSKMKLCVHVFSYLACFIICQYILLFGLYSDVCVHCLWHLTLIEVKKKKIIIKTPPSSIAPRRCPSVHLFLITKSCKNKTTKAHVFVNRHYCTFNHFIITFQFEKVYYYWIWWDYNAFFA